MLKVERRRTTKETDVKLSIDFDGSGRSESTTNLPFFDHLLTSFSKHGRFDMDLKVKGDLEVDDHHVVEDVAIALGEALTEARGSRVAVRRFGSAIVPMDDSLVMIAIDLGGRSYFAASMKFGRKMVGSFSLSNIKHFLRSLSDAGNLNLHVRVICGEDDHHIAEAIFKGLGLSLRRALEEDPRLLGQVPSTKGSI